MIAKHKFWRSLTRVHKWAGLILGVQIMLWFASGFFMSFFSIDKVHGDHMAEKQIAPLHIENIVSVKTALSQYPNMNDDQTNTALRKIILRSALGHPIWEVEGASGLVRVDAKTGLLWQGVSEAQIRTAAKTYYKGVQSPHTVLKLDTAPKDYNSIVPVWQITYDDRAKTHLYISPQTGELLKVRTRLWRVFDFMWMLHIMDYKNRDNINLWWLKLLSFCALLFSLTGIGLVIHRIFMRPKRKKPTQTAPKT
ncbi:MAG: hypothetical protein COA43_02685 [Robiginitomaculum sp.]|nr:MAG: hypothetical protein COA43_02685 [Robiginitomaculum sp.]